MKEARNCKELWDVSNGITLSEEWHIGQQSGNSKAFHRVYGMYNFTESDFYIWLKGSKFNG